MTVATANEATGKSAQATFVKVGQNLYRNESSETYYGLTKRAGKQFRTALRMAEGTAIKDRALAERALRKWLRDLENIIPEAAQADEHFAVLQVEQGCVPTIVGGLAKRWLDVQRANLKPRCITRYEQHIRGLAPYFDNVPLRKISALQCAFSSAFVNERTMRKRKASESSEKTDKHNTATEQQQQRERSVQSSSEIHIQ